MGLSTYAGIFDSAHLIFYGPSVLKKIDGRLVLESLLCLLVNSEVFIDLGPTDLWHVQKWKTTAAVLRYF
jgi:hypothetical protein